MQVEQHRFNWRGSGVADISAAAASTLGGGYGLALIERALPSALRAHDLGVQGTRRALHYRNAQIDRAGKQGDS